MKKWVENKRSKREGSEEMGDKGNERKIDNKEMEENKKKGKCKEEREDVMKKGMGE